MTRRGFTLLETIVVLVVLTVLAATLLPALSRGIDDARLDRAQDLLGEVGVAISGYEGDVGRPPSAVSHTLTQPANGTLDGCGDALTGGQLNGWVGPYLNRLLPVGGLPVAVGTMSDPLTLVDEGATEYMATETAGVEEGDALALDRRVDDGDGSAAGLVRWTTPDADGLVTLSYLTMVDCPG